MKIQIETQTTERKTIKITRSMFIDLLVGAGVDISVDQRDVSIYIDVPGGGDWSGMPLDVDDDEQAINVHWTERT